MKALLAESRASGMLQVRVLLERKGCECHMAGSLREVRTELANGSFDLFVSPTRLQDGGACQTIPLLVGSSCTAFFAVSVDEGCLWIPAVDRGRECFGSATLNPREFRKALEGIFDHEHANSRALRYVCAKLRCTNRRGGGACHTGL